MESEEVADIVESDDGDQERQDNKVVSSPKFSKSFLEEEFHDGVDFEGGTAGSDEEGGINVEKHQEEVFLIGVANTVIHPRAVVVHVPDAFTADRTVMASLRFGDIASMAELVTKLL